MKKIFKTIGNFFYKIYKNEYVRAFVFIYFVGLFFFLTRAAFNGFTLPFTGDYTSQTYNFYTQGYHIVQNFFKTGEYPLYDFSNFLGANYLGTQSFYYVFSPLFYLLCLCPEEFLYQGILFHMVFKYALGGLFMYILLRKYFRVGKRFSLIGAYIYSFSGWALFYLWFHFSDVLAFFPLLIIGFEKVLQERKGTLLAISLFLLGITNYFFLVNFVIFGMFYGIYRWIYIYGVNKKRGYDAKTRWGVFFQAVLCCLAGVLMSCVCLLPSLVVVTSSSRAYKDTSYVISLLSTIFVEPAFVNGSLVVGKAKTVAEIFSLDNLKAMFNALFVWQERKVGSETATGLKNVGYILSNWLFMNTNCWDNVIFDNNTLDNALGGFFITTPLNLLLIPSIIRAFKTKRPWTIFGVIMGIILPFIPITHYTAFAFSSLYGRWEIWIVLVGIIFIIPTLEHFELVDRRLITVNLILNYALAVACYFISKQNGTLSTGYVQNILGLKIPAYLLIAIIQLVIMLVCWFFYRFKLFKPTVVKRIMCVFIILEVGASTIATIEGKGYDKWNDYYLSSNNYVELVDAVDKMKEDTDFYRVYNSEADRKRVNIPSALNYAGASTFSSTYNYELDTFKNRHKMAYGGSWTMGYHEKRYLFDQYIGIKYYIVDKNDLNNDNKETNKDSTGFANGKKNAYYQDTTLFEEGSVETDYRTNIPWGYTLYYENDSYAVYENQNYYGIGYAVDNYILNSDSSGNATYYEELYTEVGLIEDEDQEYVNNNCKTTELEERYTTSYSTVYASNKWNIYFSPREDYTKIRDGNTGEYLRQIYSINSNKVSKSEISALLPNDSQFFHGRWNEKGYLGDQLIYKLKDNENPLVKYASKDNMAYITINFKCGPATLISLYHDGHLVTQDAHMTSNASVGQAAYEWKTQKGFYVDEPIDEIIVEFVNDTTYGQAFDSSGYLSDFNITYDYQDAIQTKVDKTINNKLQNVTYSNNKFTFNTNYSEAKLVVTSIPYDDGWTLKANGQEVQIVKVNTGFVGFIAKEGEVTYELSYMTPNLILGLFITLLGILLLIAIAFAYQNSKIDILYVENKKVLEYHIRQEQEEATYNKKLKESFKKVIKKIGRKKNMGYKSDLEIAQEAKMKKINSIAKKLDLTQDEYDCYGKYKAKVNFNVFDRPSKNGKVILVTAITPTPAGEGKTTTSIGLAEALFKLKKNVLCVLREPSLGPVMGIKGGAAGGGYAQVMPMDEINLHFTGDIHAMTTANNAISAIVDNHIYQGNELNINPETITWKRCLDLNDRALRFVEVGKGGKFDGVPRKDGFNITVASEIMAIMCLATDYKDLRRRIDAIVVGYNYDGKPVTVADLKVGGCITLLLKDAFRPNLVQTLEGGPVLIHGGPFANIAHGCNSIVATKMGIHLADYVVTEAGFGADLGAEKFFDIKCRFGDIHPSAVVLVATIRALKSHGGVAKEDLGKENVEALLKGTENLQKHIETVQSFGLPFVIAINKFPTDTKAEVEALAKWCKDNKYNIELSDVWAKGGKGGIELAKSVLKLVNEPNNFHQIYDLNDSIEEKINKVAKTVYGADGVIFEDEAKEQIKKFNELGWDKLAVCIAKTPASLSDDPTIPGRPKGFMIHVREIRPSIGAGFLVAITGKIMTMPGLPKQPAALKIDLDENGNSVGIF